MIGYYNYTVILTYLGLASAVVGMTQAIAGDLRFAMLALMICGFCDMFDGTVARTRKRTPDEVSFGAHIDSLCDVICFGAYPAIIGYGMADGRSVWTVAAMIIYVLAAVIRLAYFDVQEMARIQNDEGRREFYTGLPVTTSAIIIPGVVLISSLLRLPVARFYPAVLVLLAALFVSKARIKKLYTKGLIVVAVFGAAVFFMTVFLL